MTDDYLQRFGGMVRLYGRAAVEVFAASHVAVVGVGGVGSWVVEALARSGIGALTLIDMDDVCITNTNRQLPALDGNVGRGKVEVLAERVRLINPACVVTQRVEFLTPSNAERLILPGLSYVVDAVDRMSIKTAIIVQAGAVGVPVLTIGSAGGRRDAGLIVTVDLGFSGIDLLLQQVRRKLRRDHGFPKSTDGRAVAMGLRCVYSKEAAVYPWADGSCRLEEEPGAESGLRLDCAAGFGAATHVTGAFAFAAVGAVLADLAGGAAASVGALPG
jgi:tRNA threonylcarbamoyladenosine dehydratase